MGHTGNASKDNVVSKFQVMLSQSRLTFLGKRGKKQNLALQTLLSFNPCGGLIPKDLGILMCKSSFRSYG